MAEVDVDVPAVAPVAVGSMDINTALQEVLKKALIADGLVHGIHQACKALDKRQAVLCILAESFEEPLYKKLITALCHEHQIPLLRVDSHKKLGEWSGLCKIDKEGKPRKVCGCSVVVIKDFGEETPALDVVKEHLRNSS
ncbi:RPS12 family protein [Megaselia abdita]